MFSHPLKRFSSFQRMYGIFILLSKVLSMRNDYISSSSFFFLLSLNPPIPAPREVTASPNHANMLDGSPVLAALLLFEEDVDPVLPEA